MTYVLDGLVILIFVASLLAGWKRGFLKTMTEVLSLVAALALAMLVSKPVATFIYDTAIEPAVLTAVEEKVVSGTAQEMDEVLASLPGLARNLLNSADITTGEDLLNRLTSSETADLPQRLSDNVVRPVTMAALQGICSLLLFLAGYFLAKFLLKVLDLLAKLPLLKQANESLGLVAGVLSGLLWVALFTTVLQVLAAVGILLTPEQLNQTMVAQWIIAINPLAATLRDTFLVTATV